MLKVTFQPLRRRLVVRWRSSFTTVLMPREVWVYQPIRMGSRALSLNAAQGPGWQSTASTAPV